MPARNCASRRSPSLTCWTDSLEIILTPDIAAGTLSIKDNGVGMSEAEIIDNLAPLPFRHKKFLETLSGDSARMPS